MKKQAWNFIKKTLIIGTKVNVKYKCLFVLFWYLKEKWRHFFLFSLYYIEYFPNILDWHLQKYISLVYFRVTPNFADDIKIYTSELKSSYTIATIFDRIFKELRFLHVKFSSCRAEGTIMISSSKIRDCFWAALFFLPRVYHSWIFVSMNLIKDASKDLGLPHCTLSFKCDLCSKSPFKNLDLTSKYLSESIEETLPERIYIPIMAMFTFQLDNTKR